MKFDKKQYLVNTFDCFCLPPDEFVRRIVRQSQSSEDTLHLSAVECVKAVSQNLQKNSESLSGGLNVLMVRRLAKYNPFKDVCQCVLVNTDKREMNGYIASLLTQFSHADNMVRGWRSTSEQDDEEVLTGVQKFALATASRMEILRELERASKEVEWSFGEALEVAQFLVANGIFEIDPEVKHGNKILEQSKRFNRQVSHDVKKSCCQCLISILPILQWAISKSSIKEEMFLKMVNQFAADSLSSEGVELLLASTPEEDNCRTTLAEVTAHLYDLVGASQAQKNTDSPHEKQVLSMLQLCSTLYLYHWLAPESIEMDLVNDIPGVVVGAFGGSIEEVSASESDVDEESSDAEIETNENEAETNGTSEIKNREKAAVDRPEHYTDSLVDLILSINTRSTVPLKGKFLRDQVYFVCCAFASEITVHGWMEVFTAMRESLQSRAPVAGSEDEDENDQEDLGDADESMDKEDDVEHASTLGGVDEAQRGIELGQHEVRGLTGIEENVAHQMVSSLAILSSHLDYQCVCFQDCRIIR